MKSLIERLANLARNMASEEKIPMREAIHFIATKHKANASSIGKELNRRSQFTKFKRKKVNKEKQEKEDIEQELALIQRKKQIGCALAHEAQLQRGFRLAGHLDDY